MKKTITVLSFFLTAGIALATAGDGIKENDPLTKAFQREFAGAQLLHWANAGEYKKATFLLGGHRAEAYFTALGEVIASVRDLFYDQLPLNVMKTVDKRYPTAVVHDVREISNQEGTRYKMTIEVKQKKYGLTVSPSGEITERKEIK
jgi:hypothetical protein